MHLLVISAKYMADIASEVQASQISNPFEVPADVKQTVLTLLAQRDARQRDPYIAPLDNCKLAEIEYSLIVARLLPFESQ